MSTRARLHFYVLGKNLFTVSLTHQKEAVNSSPGKKLVWSPESGLTMVAEKGSHVTDPGVLLVELKSHSTDILPVLNLELLIPQKPDTIRSWGH